MARSPSAPDEVHSPSATPRNRLIEAGPTPTFTVISSNPACFASNWR
jgi:hypothetical protein